jgi:hypothetical protein
VRDAMSWFVLKMLTFRVILVTVGLCCIYNSAPTIIYIANTSFLALYANTGLILFQIDKKAPFLNLLKSIILFQDVIVRNRENADFSLVNKAFGLLYIEGANRAKQESPKFLIRDEQKWHSFDGDKTEPMSPLTINEALSL